MRTKAITAALFLLPAGAWAADLCQLAHSPSDYLPAERCKECPVEGADAVIGALQDAADDASHHTLFALALKQVQSILARGGDFRKDFNLPDKALLGISTGAAWLPTDRQSPLQKAAASQGAVWLDQRISARAGVELGAPIPVGPDGFYVHTGFGVGANIGVDVQHRYDPRIADLVGSGAVNQLTLPFAAMDAEKMLPGECSTLSGNGNVAVSVDSGYGGNVNTLIPKVSLGGNVSSGVVHVLSGAFSTNVCRQAGSLVQVKLSTGDSQETDENFRLFGGVQIGQDALRIPVSTGVSVLDQVSRTTSSGVAGAVEKVFSASFSTRHGDLTSTGDLQDYTFDLSRARARKAYEDALRGDFRSAHELAHCADSGVTWNSTTDDKLAKSFNEANLGLSLLTWSARSSSTDDFKTITDGSGTRKFDIFSYNYDSRNPAGGSRSVAVTAVDAMTGRVGDDGKSVYLTYDGKLKSVLTSTGDMRDLVALGSSMMGSDQKAIGGLQDTLKSPEVDPDWKWWLFPPAGLVANLYNHYGTMRTHLALTIAQPGIARIASATPDQMWAAFAAAHVQGDSNRTPEWVTPGGRAKIDAYLQSGGNTGKPDAQHMSERYWSGSYSRVQRAIADLQKLKDAPDDASRARMLRDAAKAMGNDLTAGAAFANLAGEPGRSVDFTLQGEKVDYHWNDVGADSQTVAVQ